MAKKLISSFDPYLLDKFLKLYIERAKEHHSMAFFQFRTMEKFKSGEISAYDLHELKNIFNNRKEHKIRLLKQCERIVKQNKVKQAKLDIEIANEIKAKAL